MYWHLAQVNIARAVAPLSDPRLADFAARIEEVNALADQAPGFVWRDAGGEPPADRADPCLLYNASVWESAEALKDYVYRGGHVEVFRERARWFTPGKGPHLAMWWVPAGHRPDSREAFERLDFLSARGPTAAAFPFKRSFAPPDSPPVPPPIPGLTEAGYLDHHSLFETDHLPERVAVMPASTSLVMPAVSKA